MVLLAVCCFGFGQAYIPMPLAPGAVWRYRTIEIESSMTITDFMLFIDGTDTVSLGNTYHVIKARNKVMTYPIGTFVPIEPDTATNTDVYFGAIREVGKKVYQLGIINENLLFDFNAQIGDSVPSYGGRKRVTGIDSVLVSGVFHKRYLTADAGYQVIEGVGSNRGLIPGLNDGSGLINFYCFSFDTVLYKPDTSIPCTYIYPLMYESGVVSVASTAKIEIIPNPATDIVHIATSSIYSTQIKICNSIGREVLKTEILGKYEFNTIGWAKGIYYVRFIGDGLGSRVEKLILN